MNIKQMIGTSVVGLVVLLAPLAAAEANPDTITTSYIGSAVFNNVAVGYDTGYIAPDPYTTPTNLNPANVLIGGDYQTITAQTGTPPFPLTGSINTWCVDIYHWSANISVYNVEGGSSLASVLDVLRPVSTYNESGATRVGQLVTLANEVYAGISTRDGSAAFQLAIWEITYGTFNTVAGNFQVNTTDAGFQLWCNSAPLSSICNAILAQNYVTLANTWLANLGKVASTGNYALNYLNDIGTIDANATQNMVVFTKVPEPASGALLAMGLLGFGVSRKKKYQA